MISQGHTSIRLSVRDLALLLVILVLLVWPLSVPHAQDAGAGNENDQQNAEEQAQASDADAALDAPQQTESEEELETDENLGLSDRFIPSEQISQDLGVSYPVDI